MGVEHGVAPFRLTRKHPRQGAALAGDRPSVPCPDSARVLQSVAIQYPAPPVASLLVQPAVQLSARWHRLPCYSLGCR